MARRKKIENTPETQEDVRISIDKVQEKLEKEGILDGYSKEAYNETKQETTTKVKPEDMVAPINKWPQTDEQIKNESYLKFLPGQCIIEFDKIFEIPTLGCYNLFLVKKDSYSNQLPIICKYINYYIHAYDTEHELLLTYLNIKFAIDNLDAEGEHFKGEDQLNAFVDYVYDAMFTPSAIDKINRMVEDNYLDDIERNDDSKKYATKEKKHLESLEFTNEHIRTLLKISFGIKMMTPVIFHYFAKNRIVVNKTTPHLFNAFRKLFDIFGSTCNMYNKLFVYVSFSVR